MAEFNNLCFLIPMILLNQVEVLCTFLLLQKIMFTKKKKRKELDRNIQRNHVQQINKLMLLLIHITYRDDARHSRHNEWIKFNNNTKNSSLILLWSTYIIFHAILPLMLNYANVINDEWRRYILAHFCVLFPWMLKILSFWMRPRHMALNVWMKIHFFSWAD